MTTIDLTAQGCPKCGYTLDACTGIDNDHAPKPEDLTLCINCAAYLQFDAELRMVVFPDEQLLDLDDETRLTLTAGRRGINALHDDGVALISTEGMKNEH